MEKYTKDEIKELFKKYGEPYMKKLEAENKETEENYSNENMPSEKDLESADEIFDMRNVHVKGIEAKFKFVRGLAIYLLKEDKDGIIESVSASPALGTVDFRTFGIDGGLSVMFSGKMLEAFSAMVRTAETFSVEDFGDCLLFTFQVV